MTKIRTRYAPSPTGRMHVGNLRTALYAYTSSPSMRAAISSYVSRIPTRSASLRAQPRSFTALWLRPVWYTTKVRTKTAAAVRTCRVSARKRAST